MGFIDVHLNYSALFRCCFCITILWIMVTAINLTFLEYDKVRASFDGAEWHAEWHFIIFFALPTSHITLTYVRFRSFVSFFHYWLHLWTGCSRTNLLKHYVIWINQWISNSKDLTCTREPWRRRVFLGACKILLCVKMVDWLFERSIVGDRMVSSIRGWPQNVCSGIWLPILYFFVILLT